MPTPTYEKPFVGQPFKRVQNEQKTEIATCTALLIVGEYVRDGKKCDDWVAVITSPWTSEFRFNPRMSPGSTDWIPMSEGENEARFGPGYRVLAERIDALEKALSALSADMFEENKTLRERILALEDKATENVVVVRGADAALTDAVNASVKAANETPRRNRTGAAS